MISSPSSAAWPIAAHTQQMGKLRTIGILAVGTPSSHGAWFIEFVRHLRELGWIEGANITIEYRWAEGRIERYREQRPLGSECCVATGDSGCEAGLHGVLD
jgi:putative ABC transport system substrate-binding protein